MSIINLPTMCRVQLRICAPKVPKYGTDGAKTKQQTEVITLSWEAPVSQTQMVTGVFSRVLWEPGRGTEQRL